MSGLKRWFDEHGWACSPPAVFKLDVPLLRRHFDNVIAGRYAEGRKPHGVNVFGNQLIKVSNAWWADDAIAGVVRDRRIAAIAADLLGVEELYLWSDSLYWKAPHAGEQSRIGWHQDKQYWPISSTDQMITACVALYETGPRTGGMRFADGSHRWGLIGGSDALAGNDNVGAHGLPAVPSGARWVEVCPEQPPGSVTFHHCLTFHGSGPNLADEPRRSITIHMISGEGRLAPAACSEQYIADIGVGNPFRGPLFPRLFP